MLGAADCYVKHAGWVLVFLTSERAKGCEVNQTSSSPESKVSSLGSDVLLEHAILD